MKDKATFYKSGSDIWFLGIYSNNFEDTQEDILTKAAHEEYAEWLKSTGIKPPIIVAHQPRYTDAVHLAHYMGLQFGKYTPEQFSENLETLYRSTTIAKTEMVIPLNGFMLVVGRVLKSKIELVERLMEQEKSWGMSHGFIPIKTDGNIIEKYRTFEFTVVPEALAVNKVTPINLRKRENNG